MLFSSSYVGQDDFLVFASSSTSQPETTTFPSVPPALLAQQSFQLPNLANATVPSVDNFSLPDGYIIEPIMWNLTMPTSIAVDSSNGTIYVAESIINGHDKVDAINNNNSGSRSIPFSSSPLSLVSLSQQQPQVRIVKADIGNMDSLKINQTSDSSAVETNDDNTTFLDNALNWPVIDMEVDSAGGFLYAFHDHTTISRINITSGEREDIIATEEEEVDDDDNEEQLDPLSLLIHSSSQIVLSGTEEGNHHNAGDDESGSNYGNYNPPMLYIPCVNNEGVDDLEGRYCILSIPIDSSSDDNTIVDNVGSTPTILPPLFWKI